MVSPIYNEIHSLYQQLLDGWNKRSADAMAALFQNTPAQFHGRPDLVLELTKELRQLLHFEPNT